jgi:hypothetical protein
MGLVLDPNASSPCFTINSINEAGAILCKFPVRLTIDFSESLLMVSDNVRCRSFDGKV